jgi:hypothetical protein
VKRAFAIYEVVVTNHDNHIQTVTIRTSGGPKEALARALDIVRHEMKLTATIVDAVEVEKEAA